MTDLLAYLAGEGKGYVMIPLLIIFFLFSNRSLKSAYSLPEMPEKLKKPLAAYGLTVIFICMYTIDLGFTVAKIFLDQFLNIAAAGWGALGVSIILSVAIFYLLCRTMTFNQNALNYTRIFLFIYPFISSIFPYIYVSLFVAMNGMQNFPDTYLKQEIFELFGISSILCFPWFAFFILSPKIKKIWAVSAHK